MKKKQLGQFFTTNSDNILRGLEEFVREKNVVDPFAGGGDLMLWAEKNGAKKVEGFDVDDACVDNKKVFKNDSLLQSKKYRFVLTNPPYLNINKADSNTKDKYFRKSQFEDLYQISLDAIFDSEEGIVIVPINFLSAENSEKIRQRFFSKFKIVKMNYFKEQVFEDTTYNVIAFYYKRHGGLCEQFVIETTIFPDNKKVDIELARKFSWTIGGEFLNKIKDQENILGVHRLTEDILEKEKGSLSIHVAFNHIKDKRQIKASKKFRDLVESNLILLRAIDSGTQEGRIKLENIKKYNVECLISKESSRNMIYLLFDRQIELEQQQKIIDLFNEEINKQRENHLSLFLTNFRDNDRKRISFDFVYKFINHIYCEKINPKILAQTTFGYEL